MTKPLALTIMAITTILFTHAQPNNPARWRAMWYQVRFGEMTHDQRVILLRVLCDQDENIEVQAHARIYLSSCYRIGAFHLPISLRSARELLLPVMNLPVSVSLKQQAINARALIETLQLPWESYGHTAAAY